MIQLIEYIVKRVIFAILTLCVVSVVIFGFTQLLPGNAAELSLGQFADEESVGALEADMGLDRPIYVQYFDWVSGILGGDAGTSLFWGEPVGALVFTRTVNSLYLAGLSLALMLSISIPLGILAATKAEKKVDTTISVFADTAISIPDFVWAILLVLVFSNTFLGILPGSGFVPPTDNFIEFIRHLILPSVALTLVTAAHVIRQTRRGMIDALSSDYIREARLKGLRERRVVIKHALRNGLLPTITVISFTFGWMMGGLMIIEEVFAYPGLGRLAVNSIQNRDIPVIQLTILVLAAAYIFANTVADILYTILDPTIEYGE